jgi:hypothetical protein
MGNDLSELVKTKHLPCKMTPSRQFFRFESRSRFCQVIPVMMSALLMIAVVMFAGTVHLSRCCSTSGLFAVTSFHMLAISSALSGSPSGKAIHITRNLSLLIGCTICPFCTTTLMLAEVMGESVPDDGRTRNLSGAVVFT